MRVRGAWHVAGQDQELTGGDAYLVAFKIGAPRPPPDKIKACEGLKVTQAPKAAAFGTGENQMVENRAVEGFGGCS